MTEESMYNQLLVIDPDKDIHLTPASIDFPMAGTLLTMAQNLKENMQDVVVTEETVATNKKLVAQVRKQVDLLDNLRKDMKRKVLQPYESFESQVKEIVATVKEAENLVRDQLDELEEQRREERSRELETIYAMRLRKYPKLEQLGITFDKWLKPQHLNKTASNDKVETEMVQFLEQVTSDLEAIDLTPFSSEVLVEYLENGYNLSRAMATVKIHQDMIAEKLKAMNPSLSAEDIVGKDSTIKNSTEQYTIHLKRKIDYTAVLQFMNENDIEYTTNR